MSSGVLKPRLKPSKVQEVIETIINRGVCKGAIIKVHSIGRIPFVKASDALTYRSLGYDESVCYLQLTQDLSPASDMFEARQLDSHVMLEEFIDKSGDVRLHQVIQSPFWPQDTKERHEGSHEGPVVKYAGGAALYEFTIVNNEIYIAAVHPHDHYTSVAKAPLNQCQKVYTAWNVFDGEPQRWAVQSKQIVRDCDLDNEWPAAENHYFGLYAACVAGTAVLGGEPVGDASGKVYQFTPVSPWSDSPEFFVAERAFPPEDARKHGIVPPPGAREVFVGRFLVTVPARGFESLAQWHVAPTQGYYDVLGNRKGLEFVFARSGQDDIFKFIGARPVGSSVQPHASGKFCYKAYVGRESYGPVAYSPIVNGFLDIHGDEWVETTLVPYTSGTPVDKSGSSMTKVGTDGGDTCDVCAALAPRHRVAIAEWDLLRFLNKVRMDADVDHRLLPHFKEGDTLVLGGDSRGYHNLLEALQPVNLARVVKASGSELQLQFMAPPACAPHDAEMWDERSKTVWSYKWALNYETQYEPEDTAPALMLSRTCAVSGPCGDAPPHFFQVIPFDPAHQYAFGGDAHGWAVLPATRPISY